MTGNKILIIEDNLMNLELATDLLETKGFSVSLATRLPGNAVQTRSRALGPWTAIMARSRRGVSLRSAACS